MPGPMEGVKVVELGMWVAGPAAGGDPRRLGCRRGQARAAGQRPVAGLPGPVRRDDARQPVSSWTTGPSAASGSTCAARGPGARRWSWSTRPTCSSPTCASRPGAGGSRPGGGARARNPRLVYAHITGYGMEGPDAARPAYDIGGFWARAGVAGLLRTPDGAAALPAGRHGRPPDRPRAAGAVCAALFDRERTGKGQLVSTSLVRRRCTCSASTSPCRSAWGAHIGHGGGGAGQPGDEQLHRRRREAVLADRPAGRSPLARRAPGRRSPGVGRRPASPHRGPLRALGRTRRHARRDLRHQDPRGVGADLRSGRHVVGAGRTRPRGRRRSPGPRGRRIRLRSLLHRRAGHHGRFSGGLRRHAVGGPVDASEFAQHTEEVILELGHDWDRIIELKELGAIP